MDVPKMEIGQISKLYIHTFSKIPNQKFHIFNQSDFSKNTKINLIQFIGFATMMKFNTFFVIDIL